MPNLIANIVCWADLIFEPTTKRETNEATYDRAESGVGCATRCNGLWSMDRANGVVRRQVAFR